MHASLSALSAYRQFVVFKLNPRNDGSGKNDKLPCDYRTGKVVSAHDSASWTDATTAESIAASWGTPYGYGFVFTDNDPFWFLDIDGALINDQWSPLAVQLCTLFAGCAVEVSSSGRGLHIIGTGNTPTHSCTNKALGLEFYHSGRFVALTGMNAIGDAAYDASAILPAFVTQFFPGDSTTPDVEGWSDGPCEEWNGPTDDAELIRRAMASASGAAKLGGKARFADLWLANEPVLAATYPDPNGRNSYDASAADQALANHLSFWTGRDCERIQKLMWESKLVRDKWSEREDYYLPRTIRQAVARGSDVLCDPKRPEVSLPAPASGMVTIERGGNGFLTCPEQLIHFAGCIYVRSQHRIFIPGGVLLKPEQFKVQFGGFQFHLDLANEKTTRDAWEAWTQSQAYRHPMVDGTCFRPDKPNGEIVTVSGQTFVNTYFPVTIPRVKGDPTPFLRHLAKVLPNERDAMILLSYMAACVQHQGVKFQWAPLLQGVEGNGKTLFTRCVAEAIGRRYVHFPPANEISEKFNSWLFDTIFIGVEDIYVPNQRQEVFEILKPMITSDYLAKRAMQTDQVMQTVVSNFIFNSNHKDGLKKTKNDRRVCVLFCAQQMEEDLLRDNMTEKYFAELYDWLKADGYAIVNDYLFTYEIAAEFNPAGNCQRAPVTSSTAEAIGASAGNIEQEIAESVAQGLPGFAGGWISSTWLDRLLDRMGLARKVSHLKRKEMLAHMGYVYQPALRDGRVNNNVSPEQAKSRLYVHKHSLLMQITKVAEVEKAYEAANMIRVSSLPFASHGHR